MSNQSQEYEDLLNLLKKLQEIISSPKNNLRNGNIQSPKDKHKHVQETWKINFEELEFNMEKDEIGSGNSAVVYKAKYRGQFVAVKILSKTPDSQEFEKELEILSSVRSPNVCYFFGACIHDGKYCLVCGKKKFLFIYFDYFDINF